MAFLPPLAPSRQGPLALPPELMQTLLEMGIDPYEWAAGLAGAPPLAPPDMQGGDPSAFVLPEMTVMGDLPPPETVGEIVSRENDPMLLANAGLDVAPRPEPEIGITPPEPPAESPGIVGRALGGLGSMLGDAGREALMATGFGILGAQNTYGSALSALGQGGLAGMTTYGYAKRRAQFDEQRKLQLEAQKDAAREARLQKRLSSLQTIAKTNPEGANAMLAKDPELQAYIPLLPGGTFKGDKGKPTVQVNQRSGDVFAIDTAGGSVQKIGNVGAQPPVGGGDTGQFTQELVNPETGLPEVWRFDRRGNPIAKLGVAPSKGMAVEVGPDGSVRLATGGQKLPASAETKALEAIDSADLAENVIDNLDQALEQENVGLIGDMRTVTYGALSQAQGLAFSRALTNAVGDIAARAMGRDDINPNVLFDSKLSTVQVLGNTASYLYAKVLNPDGRISDADVRNAARALGFDSKLANVDDLRHRLGMFKALMQQQREIAQSRIGGQGNGTQMAVRPREQAGGKQSAEARLKDLVAGGMSEDAAYEQLVREGY